MLQFYFCRGNDKEIFAGHEELNTDIFHDSVLLFEQVCFAFDDRTDEKFCEMMKSFRVRQKNIFKRFYEIKFEDIIMG